MKIKIGNIEQELKFMNKLYMENVLSELNNQTIKKPK